MTEPGFHTVGATSVQCCGGLTAGGSLSSRVLPGSGCCAGSDGPWERSPFRSLQGTSRAGGTGPRRALSWVWEETHPLCEIPGREAVTGAGRCRPRCVDVPVPGRGAGPRGRLLGLAAPPPQGRVLPRALRWPLVAAYLAVSPRALEMSQPAGSSGTTPSPLPVSPPNRRARPPGQRGHMASGQTSYRPRWP